MSDEVVNELFLSEASKKMCDLTDKITGDLCDADLDLARCLIVISAVISQIAVGVNRMPSTLAARVFQKTVDMDRDLLASGYKPETLPRMPESDSAH